MSKLTEHAIRPADFDAEQKRLHQLDVERTFARRAEFVEVPCPVCDGVPHKPRFDKDGYEYRECLDCGTVYISPRPTPAILSEHYGQSQNYHFWNSVIFPASEAARRELVFRPRVKRLLELCEKHGVNTDTLVEVGAGFGTFCEELRSTGKFRRVVAVEPTPPLAATCRARGLEVIEAQVEHANLSEASDVVASFEVIEHLYDPGAFIATCATVLRPGGLIVLTCPNLRGFDVDVLGQGSPAVDCEHLNYFHPASLARLLSRHGFELVESQTPGRLDADIVRNRVLAGEAKLEDGFLRRVILDDWDRLGTAFQDFLVANGLSSNMWIVARLIKKPDAAVAP